MIHDVRLIFDMILRATITGKTETFIILNKVSLSTHMNDKHHDVMKNYTCSDDLTSCMEFCLTTFFFVPRYCIVKYLSLIIK